MVDAERAPNAEMQLASFLAEYEPRIAKLGKALREKLRARLPGLFEIVYVYESQSALVISYSPIDKGYGGVCSLALYPDGVKLYFGRGAKLSKSDPKKLLQGRGTLVRHVVIHAASDLDRVEIEALMAAALKLAKVRPDARAKGSVIIQAGAQKERARRAQEAARRPGPRRPGRARR